MVSLTEIFEVIWAEHNYHTNSMVGYDDAKEVVIDAIQEALRLVVKFIEE